MIQLLSKGEPQVKFAGRVEHVDSGRADHFESVDDLVRFIEGTIAEVEALETEKPPV